MVEPLDMQPFANHNMYRLCDSELNCRFLAFVYSLFIDNDLHKDIKHDCICFSVHLEILDN